MSEEKIRHVKQTTWLEHAKKKTMWAGSQQKQVIKLKIYHSTDETFKNEAMEFVPSIYKIINEVIENAADHYANYQKLVTFIKITFEKSGLIIIHNDGPGIVVCKEKTTSGKEMYSVQMIASEFLTGDNLDDDNDRITGGTNGAGLKLANAFSDYMIVETWDEKNKKYYKQEFKDRLNVIGEPVIENSPPQDFTGTRVTFKPCYSSFGINIEKEYPIYKSLVKTRACHTAVFTGIKVYFNDKKLKIDFEKMSKMLITDPIFVNVGSKPAADFKTENGTWNLAIGPSGGKFQQLSIVNGINVYNGGTHIEFIKDQIIKYAESKIEKLIKKIGIDQKAQTHISHNLYIVMKGFIPNPEFSAQIKDKIATSAKKYEDKFKFTSKQLENIWKYMEKYVVDEMIDKVKEKKTRVTKNDLLYTPKFKDAVYADTDKREMTTLILCEGASAQTLIEKGIKSGKMPFSHEYYGMFQTGGVPMNARNESTITGGTIIRSRKLRDNERLSSLVKVLRLDYNIKYETMKEIRKLRYGCIVVATDQDEDGKGNIFGLITNFFIRFWPKLIENGFLQRLNTPIVKATTPNKIEYDFYTLDQFEEWIEKLKKSKSISYVNRISTKYMKGLGSHKDLAIPKLFEKYEQLLVKLHLDENAEETTEIYYGKDTEKRKKILSTPVCIKLKDVNNVSVSDQLNTDTKSYQRYNNLRKLPHVIDGMIPVRRKPLYSGIKIFGNSNKAIKLPLFVSRAVEMTDYPHGETSMEGSIVGQTQCFPTARNFPFFYPEGQYGSRKHGGNDAAAGRYLKIYLQKQVCLVLYPKIDDQFLEYHVEEGKLCEPVYYVPIIPMAIMESMSVPGNGWKIRVWARDFNEVMKIVYDAIKDPKSLDSAPEPKFWLNGFNPKIRILRNSKDKLQTYSIGRYRYNEETRVLTITELPHEIHESQITEFEPRKSEEKKKKQPKDIVIEAAKKTKYSLFKSDRIKYIDDIKSLTDDDEVRIEITLKPGAYDEILEKYGNERFNSIIHWLNLWTTLDSQMNMMTIKKEVKHFHTAIDVIKEWFPIRKEIYGKRINRQIILLKLQILKLENEIRFSKNYRDYKIHDITEEAANKILSDFKYNRFYDMLLEKNRDIETDKLFETICDSEEATYNYLLKMSFKSMLTKNHNLRAEKLKKLQVELTEMMDDNDPEFPGRKAWLRELDLLEKITREGIESRWGTKRIMKNIIKEEQPAEEED